MDVIKDLHEIAASYMDIEGALAQIQFDAKHYSRKTLSNFRGAEVVIICLGDMQSTDLHNHDGGTAVIRCLRGKVIERIYVRDTNDDMLPFDTRVIKINDFSLSGPHMYHQITNLAKDGSVLLNFYFKIESPK